MNRRHSRLTDWGLSHLTIGEDDAILDVGCGGGRTVAKLAGLAPRGTVYGIDYAKYADRLARWTTMAILDVEQHKTMFVDAGFAEIDVDEDAGRGWICVWGTRSA